jgi:heme exporter protein CcmD
MDLAAPHLGFVYASYALTALCLLGLIALVLVRDRKSRAEAAELEARHHKEQP